MNQIIFRPSAAVSGSALRGYTHIIASADADDTSNADTVLTGTDDEDAIQAIVDSLAASQGGTIKLVGGPAHLTGTNGTHAIEFKSNISLEMDIASSFIWEGAGTGNAYMIGFASSADNIKFKNCKFNSSGRTSDSYVVRGNGAAGTITNVKFDDCDFIGNTSQTYSLYLAYLDSVRIINCDFYGAPDYGIFFTQTANFDVRLNFAHDSSGFVYGLTGNSNFDISDNIIEHDRNAPYEVINASNVSNGFKCSNNKIKGRGRIVSNVIKMAYINGTSNHGALVNNNIITNFYGNAIDLTYVNRANISSNKIQDCAQSDYPIFLTQSDYNSFTGNHISSNNASKPGYGVYESTGSDYNYFLGNTITNTTAGTVSINGGNTTEVSTKTY